MRRIVPPLVLLASLAITRTCFAPIADVDYLTIDFTNEKDARAKAEWSIPGGDKINEYGLGCKVCSDWWIQTKPVPVGYYWRPTTGARITAKTVHALVSSSAGELYARFSPDCKHWSNWQALAREDKSRVAFKGDLGVPNRERQKYDQYLREFEKLNPEERGGEEALVKWILEREPSFFEHTLPFIGYIEFLFEGPSAGPCYIKQFKAEMSWGAPGVGFGSPNSQSFEEVNKRWRFKAP